MAQFNPKAYEAARVSVFGLGKMNTTTPKIAKPVPKKVAPKKSVPKKSVPKKKQVAPKGYTGTYYSSMEAQ